MKILYASHLKRDALKGAPWADLSLLDALRQRGHEVEEVWDVASPRTIRHDNLHLLLEAPGRCARAVLSRVSRSPFDVVFINQPLGWEAGRELRQRRPAPLYVARSHGWEPRVHTEMRPFVTDGHEARGPFRKLGSKLVRPLLDRQNRKVLEVVDGVVVGSIADRSWISRESGFPEERILAMQLGIAREFLEPGAPAMSPERLRRLLYVGQFAPFKAPTVVAEVLARVLVAMPDASVTWVCESAHHAAVQGLFPAELLSRLRLLNWMPRGELVRVCDESGIYVFPSWFEGFGQTFLEAMARGVVVMATRVGGMREVIRDGENGFLFAPGAVDEIAQRILEIVAQPERATEIAVRARQTAEAFTWARSAERLEHFLLALRDGTSVARAEAVVPSAAKGGPSVSIVIPTFGREAILIDTIRLVLSLETPADEILVVDQTPVHESETSRQLGEWDATGLVRWIRLPKPSIPGAMNEGLLQARSEVVLFLDDDLIPDLDLVEAHQRAHREDGVTAVTGMVLQPGERAGLRDRGFPRGRGLWRDLRYPFNTSGAGSVSNVMAGNLSVHRQAALAAGGFDERFVGVAYRFETEFCRRLRRTGADVRYEPRAVIRHLKAGSGGTRTWGSFQTSIRPEHSVGDYYFALREGRGVERWAYVARRLVRESFSRFHLSHPWWIPVKLLGELRGLWMAFGLFREPEKAA